MGFLRKYGFIIMVGLVVSCAKDDEPSAIDTPLELTATALEFIDEYEYVTFNFSPTSFGADRNEKWTSDIKIFLDGDFSETYRLDVENALESFNTLFAAQGIRSSIVSSLEASNTHLIFGEKEAIESVWPDMFNAINGANFSGYALYDRNANFNIVRGRIWVKSPSIPLFNHELGHIIGLGHASTSYCGSVDSGFKSFMCSGLSTSFNAFDSPIIQVLYQPEIAVGKTFAELKPVIEDLLLTGRVVLE